MTNLTGHVIGRYHILDQLGEGGMAIVYKAYDTRLERNVALKVLRTDQFIPAQLQMVLQRFEREAKSLAKLSNPNIVNILDFGEHEGMPYLVMEYLSGGTLKKKLGQPVPWREALHILLPVAHGLAYAHGHGVIHRDVKPANILLNEDNRPVLTDFGIAKLLEAPDGHTLTGSGVGIGTPEYMAPEQGMGASTIDERADVYSLGIVLYEMVTGRKPYIADTPMAVVLKQMTDPLPHPSDFVADLPESVEHILLKALAKDPGHRYANMHAMIEAMDSALAETIRIEMPAPARQDTKKETRHVKLSPKLLLLVIGIVAVAAFITFGLPWIGQTPPSTPGRQSTYTSIMFPTSMEEATLPPPTAADSVTSGTAEAVDTLSKTVLAYFKAQPPTFEDDFAKSDMVWGGTSEGLAIYALVYDGVLHITDHAQKTDGGMKPDHDVPGTSFPTNELFDAHDFALQFDFDFQTDHSVKTVAVQFRKYEFSIDANGAWMLSDTGETPKIRLTSGITKLQSSMNNLLIVAYGNNLGIYLNDIFLYSLDDISTSSKTNQIVVTGEHGSVMEFDNFKFWNLDEHP